MKVIGLTGSIASGKSTVSKFLAQLGAFIIDADIIARKVVEVGQKAYTEIVEYFGEDILALDRSLDRKKIAGRVFDNTLALQKLNAIIHPAVIEETKRLLNEAQAANFKVAVIDAPLLIEANMTVMADEIWVVIIDPDQQIKRAMERDNTSSEQIQARIAAQMPQEDKKKHATRIIDNSGTIEETLKQVKKYYAALISE